MIISIKYYFYISLPNKKTFHKSYPHYLHANFSPILWNSIDEWKVCQNKVITGNILKALLILKTAYSKKNWENFPSYFSGGSLMFEACFRSLPSTYSSVVRTPLTSTPAIPVFIFELLLCVKSMVWLCKCLFCVCQWIRSLLVLILNYFLNSLV